MWGTLLDVVLFLTSLFLILLVLVQRGKGGGLAGALGGTGGYSAFGTRAGDMFTKITIGVASFWLMLAVVTVMVHRGAGSVYGGREAQTPDITVEDRLLEGLTGEGTPDNLLLPETEIPGADLPRLTDDSSLPTEE